MKCVRVELNDIFYGYYLYHPDDNERALVLPSGLIEALQLRTCDANGVVDQLLKSFSLEQVSLEQPDPETKRKLRCLCVKANTANRLDVVKKLREIAPAGTTGKLFFDQ